VREQRSATASLSPRAPDISPADVQMPESCELNLHRKKTSKYGMKTKLSTATVTQILFAINMQ
jgi:hypothetical protein